MAIISHKFTFSTLLTLVLLLPTEHIYGADSDFDEMGSYFRLIWGLLIVLGVILILYGVLRKRLSLFHNSNSQAIKVLEIKPLMARKSLCLVEVKGEEYLLGISNDQITHIATISSSNPRSSFAETLDKTEPGSYT